MATITPTATAAAGDFFAASFVFFDSNSHATSVTLTDNGGTWSGTATVSSGQYRYSFTLQGGANQGYTVSIGGSTPAESQSGTFSGAAIVGGSFTVA